MDDQAAGGACEFVMSLKGEDVSITTRILIAGEARRNADGSVAKLIDQISDDDGDEDNELLMAGRHGSGNSFFMANALESLQDVGSSTSSVMLRAK